MLRYFFSFLSIFFFVAAFSQAPAKDSITIGIKQNRYGLRVGADLYKLARSFYDNDYQGLEIVGDYRVRKNYYLAAEIGNEKITVNDDQLNFTTSGTYIRAGFDYNAYENWLDMENMIYIGGRYGFSTMSQTLNSYKIYNRNPYFGEQPPVIVNEKYSGLTAQWIEVVTGLKAKVINNFYLGFSVSIKKLITNKKPENFDNLYIPGFNRTYDGDFGVGFNYTVSYFLPLYKSKPQVIKVAK